MEYYVKILDGTPTRFVKIVVHEFTIADIDDPEIFAAEPLYKWEHSPAGQWVMEHAVEVPKWHKYISPDEVNYRYKVIAQFRESDAIIYNLKWR